MLHTKLFPTCSTFPTKVSFILCLPRGKRGILRTTFSIKPDEESISQYYKYLILKNLGLGDRDSLARLNASHRVFFITHGYLEDGKQRWIQVTLHISSYQITVTIFMLRRRKWLAKR